MMEKIGRMTAGLVLLAAFLVGCEGSAGPGGVTVSAPTRNPSSTPRDTATLSQTLTPTITPTATKVPDLEIVNGNIIDLRDTVHGGVYVIDRIRNNTDTTMILPAREYAFVLNFESYEDYGYAIFHFTMGPYGLKPGLLDEGIKSNCILYPHEEGVIFFDKARLERTSDYIGKEEEVTGYTGPYGYTYRYESRYVSSPDLPDIYHPKAENVEYRIENGNIYFEYDINVPAPKKKETEKGMVMGYLLLYDKDGNIINILYTDIRNSLPYENRYDRLVHMQGQSPYGDVPVRWSDFFDITEDNLQEVDHIEMLFEVQYEGICFDKRFPK